MSTKYRNSRDVPLDIIITRLNELSDAITGGRESQGREFTMRIPAECDRDADLVIGEAAARLAKLGRVSELAEKIRYIAIDSPPSNNMQLIYRLACQQADEIEKAGGEK